MTKEFSEILDQVFDLRDVIERREELESFKDDHESDPKGGYFSEDESQELDDIVSFMDEVKGYGGDEQFNGDWYPLTFIRDDYFVEYAEELLKDCGDLPQNIPHYIEIDWQATANNILVDYASVEIDGTTYWYR